MPARQVGKNGKPFEKCRFGSKVMKNIDEAGLIIRGDPLQIKYGVQTNQGRVRTSNEDWPIANPESRIFIVADGMGGHAAGEIASRMTAERVEKVISEGAPGSGMEGLLIHAVQEANTTVHEEQKIRPGCRGMGSTLTALAFSDNRYHVAQVGDSRAYLLRNNSLTQLTQDHSVVWALYTSGTISKEDISRYPQKNLITRSIGTQPQVEADVVTGPTLEGDLFLLCSDGLTDVLSDSDILQVLLDSIDDPQQICDNLVDAANAGGGPDNITVVVAYLTSDPHASGHCQK
jgi:protein phosphatase